MRRRFAALTLAGLIVLAASLGAVPAAGEDPAVAARPGVAVQVPFPGIGFRDQAAMVLVGTLLIALAAAVRRVP